MSNVDNKNSNGIPSNNIGLLMDVTINVTVELGRARLSIREILSLGEGSIIELQKLAGEPVDLLVNGKLIAKGEVVVDAVRKHEGSFGYDAMSNEYVDMFEAGIVDPAKVTRSALENAASEFSGVFLS